MILEPVDAAGTISSSAFETRTVLAGLGLAVAACLPPELSSARPNDGSVVGSGGTANGGVSGASGSVGGVVGSSATAGTAQVDGSDSGGAMCARGEKFCNGECTVPRPLVGCSLSDCTPCTGSPPANAQATCEQSICSFECEPNYQPVSGMCAPIASDGATGSGGTAGTTGADGAADTGGSTCVPQRCPGCVPHGPLGCCLSNGKCGCTWAPGAVCYPG